MKIPPRIPPHSPQGPLPPQGPSETSGQQAASDLRWITGLLSELTQEMISTDPNKLSIVTGLLGQIKAKADDLSTLAADFPQYPFLEPMINGLVVETQNITMVPAAAYAKTPPDDDTLIAVAVTMGTEQSGYALLNNLFPPS